jgi:DNA-binding response OmpR family regulator
MKRPRILLVEDNRLLRWWLMLDLLDAGYWVAGPDTIEEAIHWADTIPFDVLLTDWRLPVGHDGFEMLEHVRAHSPEVLPILMSAELDDELAGQARAVGFRHMLVKPFRSQELLEALQNTGLVTPPALPVSRREVHA